MENKPCQHCQSTENVYFRINPYRDDLYDDQSEEWICNECFQNLKDDI